MHDRHTYLMDKTIAVIGLGATGLSCLSFLAERCQTLIGIDSREDFATPVPENVLIYRGELRAAWLKDVDIIVLSPGISRQTSVIKAAIDNDIPVIGDIELFSWFNTLPVLAITGSNGKSTVTELTAAMLRESGLNVLMGGNIGIPALTLLNSPADVVVLELSSFQLESLESLAPLAATVLNVSPDHLDRYRDLDEYRDAKLRIYARAEYKLYNRADRLTWSSVMPNATFGLDRAASGWGYDADNKVVTLDGEPYLRLPQGPQFGTHHALNVQAAAALARWAGADDESINVAVQQFAGLPHRCQQIALRDGVHWVNDSKATNVGACVAAIDSLYNRAQRLILIAGGEAKGADLGALKVPLTKVDSLITLGLDGRNIAALKPGAKHVDSLAQAVQMAADYAQPGDTVLLSPACASKDMFTDYQHRGHEFARLVKELDDER